MPVVQQDGARADADRAHFRAARFFVTGRFFGVVFFVRFWSPLSPYPDSVLLQTGTRTALTQPPWWLMTAHTMRRDKLDSSARVYRNRRCDQGS